MGVALLGSLLVQQTLGSTGAAYLAAYTSGLHLIAIIAGLVALVGVVVVLLPSRSRSGDLPADDAGGESRPGDDADDGLRSSPSGSRWPVQGAFNTRWTATMLSCVGTRVGCRA